MRLLGRSIVIALILGLAVTCSHEIAAENYNRSCAQDSDCEIIHLGDRCACNCSYGAINRSDTPRYREDAGQGDCNSGCGSQDCKPCGRAVARCEQSLCVARFQSTLRDAAPEAAPPRDTSLERGARDTTVP